MKFKIGDKVKVIKDVDEHKAGDIHIIENFRGQNSQYDYGFLNAGYIKEENIKLVKNKKKIIKKLKKENKQLKLEIAKLRKTCNQVKKELVKIKLNNFILFKGEKYKKVKRKAKLNDVVVFVDSSCPWNAVPGNYYLVDKESKIGAAHIGDSKSKIIKFNIYENGRNSKNVEVYEKVRNNDDYLPFENINIENINF